MLRTVTILTIQICVCFLNLYMGPFQYKSINRKEGCAREPSSVYDWGNLNGFDSETFVLYLSTQLKVKNSSYRASTPCKMLLGLAHVVVFLDLLCSTAQKWSKWAESWMNRRNQVWEVFSGRGCMQSWGREGHRWLQIRDAQSFSHAPSESDATLPPYPSGAGAGEH